MKSWITGPAFVAGLLLAQTEASAQVAGVYVLDRLMTDGKEISASDYFTEQFSKNLPEGFAITAVRFAYVFNENVLTAHMEVLANTEQLGHFTCAADLTMPVRWRGGELTIPVSAQATSTFRDIDEGQEVAGDEQMRCAASLQHGKQKIELDGEEMRMQSEGSDDIQILRKAKSPVLDVEGALATP